jgi:sortase B
MAYLGNWLYEGNKVKNIRNDLENKVEITEVVDSNNDVNDDEIILDNVVNDDMYWKYLNTPLSSVNFNNLVKENSDTVGWLIVNNTNVDYPVVQTIDNDYYLTHAFDKSNNKAGWVYADYRNDIKNLDRNTVIYGHGRKDGVMFGSLVNTLDSNWYTNPDNQIIQLSTLEYDSMWQIFSIYKIEAESYYITTEFSSDTTYRAFIDTMKSRSIYDFNINVSTSDKLLTLSTCYNDYGMRLVVQAKLIKQVKKS